MPNGKLICDIYPKGNTFSIKEEELVNLMKYFIYVVNNGDGTDIKTWDERRTKKVFSSSIIKGEKDKTKITCPSPYTVLLMARDTAFRSKRAKAVLESADIGWFQLTLLIYEWEEWKEFCAERTAIQQEDIYSL